jgi:hypothetical protein
MRSASLLALTLVLLGVAACSDDGGGDAGGDGGSGTNGAESGGGGNLPGTGGAGTGGGSLGTGAGAGTDCGADACPLATGLEYACQQRFALGLNYAWHEFAADFGGVPSWNQKSISEDAATFATELAAMKESGASVIRWWMFPEFRSAAITFDASDEPTGFSAGATADIQKALELAEQADVYLALTLFSFDNFRATHDNSGLHIPGLGELVVDPAKRAKVIEHIVRPAAQAVAESPYAHRLLGWDVINEPEWAIQPVGGGQDQDFTPTTTGERPLSPIPLADMKALINETLAALREETPQALLSVGWAAAKWQWAFGDVTGVDFHQPHIYAWVNDYWPYTMTPAALGYGDKPTVMGEFYLMATPFTPGDSATFATILESWYTNGYAGAWAWQYNEATPTTLELLSTFAATHSCEVSF